MEGTESFDSVLNGLKGLFNVRMDNLDSRIRTYIQFIGMCKETHRGQLWGIVYELYALDTSREIQDLKKARIRHDSHQWKTAIDSVTPIYQKFIEEITDQDPPLGIKQIGNKIYELVEASRSQAGMLALLAMILFSPKPNT